MTDLELEGHLTDYFVTEAIFDSKHPLDTIEKFLKNRKTTGKIYAEQNMSQGGNLGIKVVERTKLTDAQALHIREYLGMK